MIHLRSDLLIFLSSFLIIQVFVLLFTFWVCVFLFLFFQLYHPHASTEFTISAEALLVSKKPFNCPHPVLV